jgi:DNA-binding MarR family transcriptional regulator
MSTVHIDTQRSAGPGDDQVAATVAAWRALDTAHAKLSNELTAALQRHHHLSINAHAVLAQLLRAPDEKLRMTEIAHRINFSLSGLTGLVGRLERDGLVERQSNVADRRVIYACLTDLGRQYANDANLRHRDTLDTSLNERLTPSELATLTDLLRRVSGSDGTADGRA